VSYLYLICTMHADGPSPPCKVGITNSPRQRLKTIQTGSPKPLLFYEVWSLHPERDLAKEMERLAHYMRRNDRLYGEWFSTNPEEYRQIIELCIRWSAQSFAGEDAAYLIDVEQIGLLDRNTLRPRADSGMQIDI
jgi:hypothetical protein